jgi:plastocyanin
VNPSPPPSRPWRFLIAVIVLSTLVSAAIGYLGATGKIGGAIPGSTLGSGSSAPPINCQGGTTVRSYFFEFIAGIDGSLSFNHTTPGPCVRIPAGSSVNVTFQVDPTSNANHSWVLVPNGGAKTLPVFPGAGFSNDTRTTGIAPGSSAEFTFVVSTAGTYEYICEVDDHSKLGMYGYFYVTAATT